MVYFQRYRPPFTRSSLRHLFPRPITFVQQKPAGSIAAATFVAFRCDTSSLLPAARLVVFVHAEDAGEACPPGAKCTYVALTCLPVQQLRISSKSGGPLVKFDGRYDFQLGNAVSFSIQLVVFSRDSIQCLSRKRHTCIRIYRHISIWRIVLAPSPPPFNHYTTRL